MAMNARRPYGERSRRRRGVVIAAGVGLTLALTGSGVAAVAASQAEQAADAKIVVDATTTKGNLSGKLNGANVNQWFDGASGLWDAENDRPNPDVVAKSKRAGMGMLRFPGGTSANLYDWKKGIGPTEQRGCQTSGHDDGKFGVLDSDYGPDEFMEVIQATGADPTIMMPTANETPADAADWVEYMNAEVGENPNGGKDWAQVREDNGHAKPYNVQQWEIANEPERGGQGYWRSDDRERRLEQYVVGGREKQVGQNERLGQRLARGCDRRIEASDSDGSADQVFQMLYPPVVPGSQSVRVRGEVWQPIDDLSNAGPNEKVYEIDPKTGVVRFGDGEHGAVPENGRRLGANYKSGLHKGFVDFYDAMKQVDPSIDVCGTWAPIKEGQGYGGTTFAEKMVEKDRAGDYDCVVIHPYTSFGQDFGDAWDGPREGHDEHMIGDRRTAKLVRELQRNVAEHSTSDAYVATSEFGALWFGSDGGDAYANWNTSMSHATYMASQWSRYSQRGLDWAMGNTLISEAPTGLRAVLGGQPDFVFTAEAVVREQLKAMFDAAGKTVDTSIPQNVKVNAVGNDTTYGALRSTAGVGEDGKLRIFVVNRHPGKAISANVVPEGFEHAGQVAITTVAGDSFESFNGPGHEEDIQLVESSANPGSGSFDHEFPAASTTMLELTGAER